MKDHLSSSANRDTFLQLLETVHRLRAPGGCPWDRAQTHQSLRPYLIEEAYEVLDVLDQIERPEDLPQEKIKNSFREELGDLLMQVLLHSEMAHEVGAFHFWDVAKTLNDKLIRRHPHVFGEIKVDSADAAFKNWEKEKAKEKASQPDSSILDGIPKNLPTLHRTARTIEKVSKVGFQWNDLKGPMSKLDEELSELKKEIQNYEKEKSPHHLNKIESELGDLLFALCNFAFLMKLSPETALRGTLARFEKRFRHVEKKLKEIGKTPEQSTLSEMDAFWEEAKRVERVRVWGLTGGIASGKSTVAKIFAELGIPVIDADQIARDLIKPGSEVEKAVIQKFDTADRKELRKRIFEDPQAKKDLENLLHPLIQEESKKQIESLAPHHSVIIYEAALLVETGRYQDLTGLIVVKAPKELRLRRLMSRDAMDSQIAEKMINSQTSDEERENQADIVIENEGSLQELKDQIVKICL